MEILNDLKNELLNRREIEAVIKSEGTPSFEECKKKIAEKFNAPEENIIVRKVKGHFGTNNFSVEAFIYNSKEDKEKIEPKVKEKKKEDN